MVGKSMGTGVLIGFLASLMLSFITFIDLSIMGAIIPGFIAGYFAGGGMRRGLLAGTSVWFLNFLLSAFLIGSSWSSLFGPTIGAFIGIGSASIFSLFSIVDLMLYGLAGAVGGMLDNE